MKDKIKSVLQKNRYCPGFLVSVTLFLLLLPLSLKIDFMQNDDWIYYGMVERFMGGDFHLDPLLAPTFYTQGLIGTIFAYIFSIEKLPILTLIVSVLCFYVLYLILTRHLGQNALPSLLLSLLVFFNPLFVYSIWGFMTENYFLLFLLLSIYFYLEFSEHQNMKNLVLYILLVFLALNVRQVALALPLTGLIHAFFKKSNRLFLINLVLLLGFSLYLKLLFPTTQEMSEKSLQFHHLKDFSYVYALIYGSFLVVTATFAPIMLPSIDSKNKLRLLILVFLAVIIYLTLNRYFEPEKLSWGEFPYLENTFERKGFYPRGILGTKYHFRYMFDLYRHWDTVAKITIAAFISAVILRFRKVPVLWSTFIVVYMGVMTVTETYYDRYLVPVLPIFLFLIVEMFGFGKLQKLLTAPFLAFLVFLNYQFSLDFILANKYVWNKSKELVITYEKEPKRIQGASAWNLKYPNPQRNYVFDFTYDNPKVNEPYRRWYTLEEVKNIDFPGSLWVNAKIYLYRKNN